MCINQLKSYMEMGDIETICVGYKHKHLGEDVRQKNESEIEELRNAHEAIGSGCGKSNFRIY